MSDHMLRFVLKSLAPVVLILTIALSVYADSVTPNFSNAFPLNITVVTGEIFQGKTAAQVVIFEGSVSQYAYPRSQVFNIANGQLLLSPSVQDSPQIQQMFRPDSRGMRMEIAGSATITVSKYTDRLKLKQFSISIAGGKIVSVTEIDSVSTRYTDGLIKFKDNQRVKNEI